MARKFIHWVPLGAAITVLCGLIYLALQQNMRTDFNEPQIELAEDAAAELGAGQEPAAVLAEYQASAPHPVDMGKSLSYFLIIFDGQGTPIQTSGVLDGKTPVLPAGVLDYVRKSGEDRITWQPRDGVRVAAVITGYGGDNPGFVLTGANMRELERRESALFWQVASGWLIAMILSLATAAYLAYWSLRFDREMEKEVPELRELERELQKELP